MGNVLYLPVVRQTDNSKKPFFLPHNSQCTRTAPVVSQANETRKAEKELDVLGLVTSAS